MWTWCFRGGTRRLALRRYRRHMEEARRVLARLERIEALDRDATPARVLLAEVRGLLADAEAWTRAERADTARAEEALARCRQALDGDAQPTLTVEVAFAEPPL